MRVTLALRGALPAMLAGVALLLAACGQDSIPKLQLASGQAAPSGSSKQANAGQANTSQAAGPASEGQAGASQGSGGQAGAGQAGVSQAAGQAGVSQAAGRGSGQAGASQADASQGSPSHGAQATPNAVATALSKVAVAGAAASSPPVVAPAALAGGHAIPAGARLIIPRIGVDAPMVSLAVDGNGVMQVPEDGAHAGWYTFSAVPGSAGNAVISGHLDTATSTTAVFSRLKDLRQGDAVDVVDGGKQTDFDVFWSKSWPDDTAPLALILGNAPSPTLTLITCAGTWDKASKNYSNRLVVRAKLPGSV